MNRASEHPDSMNDWTRTPAAIFASAVLIVIAIVGITLAWNRSNTISNPSVLAIQQTGESINESSEITDDLNHQPSNEFHVIHRIDINTATLAELDLIPGIGPSLAQSIFEYRRDHGRFHSIDDLDSVSGIGPKTIEKIEGYAIVTQGG